MAAMSPQIRAILDMAEEKLKSARLLLNAGHWRDAASRAYYCAFHAASAVLLAKGLSFSRHSQAIGAFNREFVKSGLFPRETGRRLNKMQTDREAGDYRASSPMGKTVAGEDVAMAAEFLESCRRFLESFFTSKQGEAGGQSETKS
jgi:uncharacterized protein (UPF0332 family)